MAVPGITLVFRRSPVQEAALKDLLSAQQKPGSPLYHRWLTPETFAARFGVANEDIVTTENWLVSRGFHIQNVARSRDRITFSGNAAQVGSTFGTELHSYRAEDGVHFAPASDLTLPASLASVTAAVLHLSDFRPKPSVKVATGLKPDYTSYPTQAHYLGPKDILTMYDANPLYEKGIFGAGQGLAVVGQSFVNTGIPSSVETFQALLTQYTFINSVLVPNSGVEAISLGDEGESEIDLEYASGIAQNANIFLVYVGSNQNYSVFDALTFAITERIAPVVSISYGICEPLLTTTDLDQFNALFEEASAQGQTLIAAAGDSGSTACAPVTVAEGATVAQEQELSVSFPASSPNVTAVGGTQMQAGTFTTGNSPYWATATNLDNVSSLLSYVPETVWNEGSASSGIVAGGGGTSIDYPRPAWQTTFPGVPPGSNRLVPDIALQSSVADPGFIICTSDAGLLGSQGQTAGCSNGLLASNNKFTLAGGTSFAAPIFAGFVALLNQAENATGQGNINPELYTLASNPNTYATVFHDITSGTNACVAGATNCVATDQSSYGAAAGYDEATGLGSFDLNALVAAWPLSDFSALQSSVVLITGDPITATSGQTIPLQFDVSPLFSPTGNTVPIGSLSVSVDGTVVNSSLALSPSPMYNTQAAAEYDFVAPAAAGSHLISVTYSGDTTHSPATATTSVTVGDVLASGGLSLSAPNLSIANDSSGSAQVTITPSGGYDGRIVWSLSATGAAGSNLTGCYAIASLPVSNVTTTNLTIGVGTSCKTGLPERRGFKTSGKHALAKGSTPSQSLSTLATTVFACMLLCGYFAGWRRKWNLCLLWILLLPVAGANLSGCGGSGGGGGNNGGSSSPPSTTTNYTITLTGTDSVNASITASTTFTLTVQ